MVCPFLRGHVSEVAQHSRSDLAAAGLNKKFSALTASWGCEAQRAKLSVKVAGNFGQAWPVNYCELSMQKGRMKLEMKSGKIWGDSLEGIACDGASDAFVV